MCQGCVNNGYLSQDTYDAIEDFIAKYPDAESGPGHIVLADCNVEDKHIKWCIQLANAAISGDGHNLSQQDIDLMNELDWYKWHSKEIMLKTVEFLEGLLMIPESVR